MRQTLKLAAVVAIIAATAAAAVADEPQVDFAKDIQPILKESCLKCHSLDKKHHPKGAAELRLDDPKLALKGGRSGPAIIPGDAKDSLLYKLLSGPVPRPDKNEDEKDIPPMPLAKRGQKFKPLPQDQIDLIRRWIDQGAKWSS